MPVPHPTASPPPQPAGAEGLRAGFGRADITPPPGVGLVGYGPEGKRSRGYRHRLYARALLLEDASGERLALVAVDLGQLSPLLHRTVAQRVLSETRVGADRLILAATHTHAGPGHHFGIPAYDQFGSSVAGFDPAMVEFLATRIARAVLQAHDGLRAAKAAWGTAAVWGLTRNRSPEAFAANPAEWTARFPRPLLPPGTPGNVDSTLAVLRVDLVDEATGEYRPAGALSIFAIHGTGNPSANELLDGDIHAIAERVLEAHIDSLNGRPRSFRPGAVHLLMNGAEGDVAPAMPANTRCQVPILQRVRRPAGTRSPPGPERWMAPPADAQAACLARARRELEWIGDSLGSAAVRLFDGLEDRLTRDFRVRRAFRVARLAHTRQLPGLCWPQPGSSTLAGAEDGRTRYRHWRLLGLIDVGFAEDSATATRADPEDCQGRKRPLFGPLLRPLGESSPFPEVAQLTVAQVGPMLIAALPFEVTTVAGGRIREAVLDAAVRSGTPARDAVLVSLANGYNQYLTTRAEYALQHYEGGSTLYGPGTAEYVTALMAELAERLPPPLHPSPAARVPPLTLLPWEERRVLAPPDAGPPPDQIYRALTAAWQRDTLVVRWNDVHPGRLVPANGPVLRVDRRTQTGWLPLTWDDDRALEVWALGDLGQAGYQWEARWSPATLPVAETRIVLLARPGLPQVTSAPIPPPTRMGPVR